MQEYDIFMCMLAINNLFFCQAYMRSSFTIETNLQQKKNIL